MSDVVSEPDDETSADRERRYEEVSIRAVELLARAQRTADEAVAEAQAYARDLEVSARAQYSEILHRAQVAARELQQAGRATENQSDDEAVSTALTDEIEYVRTYAKVAHAQLRTVLNALTDELDNLAAVAAGRASDELVAEYAGGQPSGVRNAAQDDSPRPSSVWSMDSQDDPTPRAVADDGGDTDDGPDPAAPASVSDAGADDRVWPPIFDEQATDESVLPSAWRNSYQPR